MARLMIYLGLAPAVGNLARQAPVELHDNRAFPDGVRVELQRPDGHGSRAGVIVRGDNR